MNNHRRSTTKNKPVVVLAGWFGCQTRNLRRYIQMYNSIGWDTIVKIASPMSVVTAMKEGPLSYSSHESDLKYLAMDLLQEIQTLPPFIVFHMFSNGGCFLWEWFRYLLFEQHDIDAAIDVQNIRQKLIGVVFDSSPAYYDGEIDTLQLALEYVSPDKRKDAMEIARTLDPDVAKQRFHDYWNGLCNDRMNIPQLYLYSSCDKLASAKHIEQMIEHRKELVGKKNIWKHNFIDSEHCSHLLKHPEKYHRLVKQFLSFCTRQSCDKRDDLPAKSKL